MQQINVSNNWIADNSRLWLKDVVLESQPVLFRKLKAVCEIAFLEHFVSTTPNLDLRGVVDGVLFELVSSQRFQSLMRHNVRHANLFLPILYSFLTRYSETIRPELKHNISLLIGLFQRESKERLPFRIMDAYHGLHKLTGEKTLPEKIDTIAAFGSLGKAKYLHDISLTDDYAITHTIFYLTDFGTRKLNPSVNSVEFINEILTTLGDKAIDENNLDLLSEYALCKQCLHQQDEALSRFVNILQTSFVPAGYWPGPVDLHSKLRKEGIHPEQYPFLENYHTTILANEVLKRHSFGNQKPSPNSKTDFAVPDSNTFFFRNAKPANTTETLVHLYESTIEQIRITGNFDSTHFEYATEDLFEPEHILSTCNYFFYMGQRSVPPPDRLKPLFEAVCEENPQRTVPNFRFLRMWLLSHSILERTPINILDVKRLVDQEISVNAGRITVLDADVLISAALINRFFSPAPALELWSIIKRKINLAVVTGDLSEFCSLFATCLIVFDRELLEENFESWYDYYLSMNCAGMNYGWIPLTDAGAVSFSIKAREVLLAGLVSEVESEFDIHHDFNTEEATG